MKKLLAVALVCALGAGSAFAGEEIRAVLLHLGHNLWCDWYAPDAPAASGRGVPDAKLRCQDELWRRATDYVAAKGCNMVVVDLGEGLVYPSHPELAVEGSWSADKMRAEVKRLREIGLEPIPKLNFSTTHNGWLKQYRRMVSTPTYYKVCEDLIADVHEIFGAPRFIHIGCDEETATHQVNSKRQQFICVRVGDLWWHDFLHLVKTVERHGARAWAWSDYGWDHPEEFVARCPKSVLLSNWYYDESDGGFELAANKTDDHKRLNNFYVLEKAGYDQVPCGTTYVGWMRKRHGRGSEDIIGNVVRICRRDLTGGHLKGFMMAAWVPCDTEKSLAAVNHATDLFAQALVTGAAPSSAAPADFVDPMIGTAGGGNTLPGPLWPLGMVQPGPDTAYSTKYGGYGSSESGYATGSTMLMGFTQTHLSGTGCCDLQDFLLLPFVGEYPSAATNRFTATIDKKSERTEPGYYAVSIPEFGVKAELTASKRVAYHRYTYAKGGRARVFVDLQAGPIAWWRLSDPNYPRDRVTFSESTFSADGVLEAHNRVTCWNANREICCKIAFSPKPVAVTELPANGKPGKRYVVDFDLKPGAAVLAKAAVSSVDVEGARKNFATDPDDFDFDARRAACRDAWNKLLGSVAAEGSDAQKKLFYTALYHAYVQPNLFSDADGRCRYTDNGRKGFSKVVTARNHDVYSTLSLWDTYRAAHPLYTIVTPSKAGAFARSLLDAHAALGFLPKWQMFGGENYCMVAAPAVPVLTDAWLKGLVDVPVTEALAAVEASLVHYRSTAELDKYGYFPCDDGSASVSRTLEFGLDDACAAILADRAGEKGKSALYRKRSESYRNLFDATTGLMRGRHKDGRWRTPFDPYQQRPLPGQCNDYTEGGAMQYSWHVLQDPSALAALHGGPEGFAKALSRLFADRTEVKLATGECSGRIGQFALGNEHDQHVPYLWQYANRPDRTAEIVRELCDRYFSDKPNGICGNDDCGQISAWYVFACLGFYPVNPVGGDYVIGAPQIPAVTIRLENGRTFRMVARGLSKENRHVKSVTLNGRKLDGFILRHADLMAGGELAFEMVK